VRSTAKLQRVYGRNAPLAASVPVAMVRAGVGRTPGGDRRVVQAGDPGHLGRHAVLSGISRRTSRRKADRGGGRIPGYPAFLADVRVRRRPRDGGAPCSRRRGPSDCWFLQQPPRPATCATRWARPIILVTTYRACCCSERPHRRAVSLRCLLNLAMAGLLGATCVGKTAAVRAVAASVRARARGVLRSHGVAGPNPAVLWAAASYPANTTARVAVWPCLRRQALAPSPRFPGRASTPIKPRRVRPKTLFRHHLHRACKRGRRREIGIGRNQKRKQPRRRHDGRGLPPTSPRRRVAGPCSGLRHGACLSTPIGRDVAAGTRECFRRGVSYRASSLAAVRDRPLVTRPSSSVHGLWASVACRLTDSDPAIPCRPTTCHRVRHHDTHCRWLRPIDLQGGQFGRPLSDLPGISAICSVPIPPPSFVAVIFGRCRCAGRRPVFLTPQYRDRDVGGFDLARRQRTTSTSPDI